MLLDFESAIGLYQAQIAKGRGDYMLLNRAALESALASPYAGFGDYEKYPTDLEKIAVLIFKVGKAHAFSDGNKRLAWLLGVAYAGLHGYQVHAGQLEAYKQVNGLMCERELTTEFVYWLNEKLVLAEGQI